MNIRSIIATTCILFIFGCFLYWLYSIGKISSLGIVLLVVGGIAFVTVFLFLYKQLWSDTEWDSVIQKDIGYAGTRLADLRWMQKGSNAKGVGVNLPPFLLNNLLHRSLAPSLLVFFSKVSDKRQRQTVVRPLSSGQKARPDTLCPEETNLLDYLSTHPTTKKRIEQARHYSESFKQGLTVCE